MHDRCCGFRQEISHVFQKEIPCTFFLWLPGSAQKERSRGDRTDVKQLPSHKYDQPTFKNTKQKDMLKCKCSNGLFAFGLPNWWHLIWRLADVLPRPRSSSLGDWSEEIVQLNTSSTAQGGGGSFKNRKRIGEIDCCEWRMSEQKHWPTD